VLDPLDALAIDPVDLSDLTEETPFVGPELPPTRPERVEPIPSSVRIPRGRPLRHRSTFPNSPPLVHWLGRHLTPGEATVWVGSPATLDPLLELFYAGVARAGGRLSLIEGANRFQPYRIGETGRSLGIDPGRLLDRIRLARAFTAYQLVALVDGWASEARRRRPTVLVGHDLPALFETAEVPEDERAPLLTHVAETLRATLRAVPVPLVLTLTRGFSEFPGLTDRGPRLFDLIRVGARRDDWKLEALRDGSRLTVVPRPAGQWGLEEFGSTGPEEVTAWAAQFQRTARRLRSG
jgi:hypothetical protein